jgi:aerobic-type carbon monoxide dehydrogenase small subunit (CoxS/CutS family)
VNGRPILSCITLIGQVAQDEVLTIEGLAEPTRLHPVQDAFDQCGALQCGFCQSGMMMSAAALLEINKKPSTQEINEALGGNLCRCTGYTKIIEAVHVAAKTIADEAVVGEAS